VDHRCTPWNPELVQQNLLSIDASNPNIKLGQTKKLKPNTDMSSSQAPGMPGNGEEYKSI
jgi:hypothetical protein